MTATRSVHRRQVTLRLNDGSVLCERCVVADSLLARTRGLLGRNGLAPGEGLLLRPASAIHSWFMRFPFDAVFLDGDRVVVGIAEHVAPWRMRGRRGARAVLELAAGECTRRGLHIGARLAAVPEP